MKNSTIPVFILAGGLGTRISEESTLRPKPMIEVGEIPILIHVMRHYYAQGFNDFVICAGYKSWEIKSYFLNYEFRSNHLAIDHRESLRLSSFTFGENQAQEKWRVRVIDTGLNCMTGGRVARALDCLKDEKFETFALTYGDGLCDVNLNQELEFHKRHQKIGTILSVRPAARWGELDISESGKVESFVEKPESKQGLINGGFFFFKREFRKYLRDEEDCILERAPLKTLVDDGELCSFRHLGFWQPMDTLRDKTYLQELWDSGRPPWLPALKK